MTSVNKSGARRWARGLLVLGAVLMALLVWRLGSGRRGVETPAGLEDRLRDGAPGPTWIVDPETPGPDFPPVGRSLFDFVFTREVEPEEAGGEGEDGRRVWDVPFPFAALLARVEERLGVVASGARVHGSYDGTHEAPGESPDGPWDRSAGSPISPVRRVLVPLGRSLQRAAGAPRFFRFPRAVAAVDREPAPVDPGTTAPVRPLLADRLYLGYHEKAEVVEVISYNEAAGRFEFQVVEDYRPGGRTRVTYASRRLCTACHQNAAPLFARQLWDETNANRRVAELLERAGRDFYGFPVHQGVDEPYRVDIATDRANRFAAYQLLWRQGCESPECRGALLVAALQSRLTGGRRFDSGSAELHKRFLVPFVETFRRRWPRGLALPDPDIPNRDPLAEALPAVATDAETAVDGARGLAAAPSRAAVLTGLSSPERAVLGEVLAATHIPARLEPLDRRSPLEVWTVDGATEEGGGVPEALIAGLGELLADADLRRLDRWLFQRAEVERRRFSADCRVSVRRAAGGFVDRIKLRCRPGSAPDPGLELDARVYLDASGRVVDGTVHQAVLVSGGENGGVPEPLRDLEVAGGRVELDGLGQGGVGRWGRGRLELAEKASGLHVRRADGDALEELRLSWSPRGAGSSANLPGRVELVVRRDFAPVRAAIDTLRRRTEAGESDALSEKPFRRAVVMRELLVELGAAGADERWCCVDASGMPTAVLQSGNGGAVEELSSEEPAAVFHRYCGECHDIPSPSPPNFLYGSPERVRASLESCAERIFFRLSMWQRVGAGRAKTPMPPEPALVVHGLSAPAWASHPDLDRLRRHAGELIRAHGGTPPRLAEMTSRAYERLPSCLPIAEDEPREARGRTIR